MGAYTRALHAHTDALWPAKDELFACSMAQTLCNAPLVAARRRGVASRTSREGRAPNAYNPIDGGLIALALASTLPLDAAAELNIHYWTQADAPPRDAPSAFTPINLFALWELYQRTHDADLLARLLSFSPARLPADGRSRPYPKGRTGTAVREPRLSHFRSLPVPGIGRPHSDYVAYVIRAARLLRAMAIRI